MIGNRLREARLARQLSLNDVAGQADISVATLSRIERDKQAIHVGLFLVISKILRTTPHELLGDEEESNSVDPLIRKIAAMETGERAKFWRTLAETRRLTRGRGHRGEVRALAREVEELLAQVDFLREEIDAVRKHLRR
jgi:transcriptional regulator with XRE-family HTH domain